MTRSLAHNAGQRAKPTAWMAHAACAGRVDEMYPDLRGGEGVRASARAKAICRACPAIEPCKEYAMAEPIEPHGVWGGMSPEDRRQLRARRNRLKAAQ